MSPKVRFQIMLDPDQLAALRGIEQETGAAVGESIRRAIDAWLYANRKDVKVKSERKRAPTRKR